MRLFFPYLAARAILEIYSQHLANKGIHNGYLVNIIGISASAFYLLILSRFIENKVIRKGSFYLGLLILIEFIFNCIFILPLKEFHLIELEVSSFILLCASIFFFYELLSYPNDAELLKYPPFWIVTGVLFNYAGVFPFFLFYNFISKQSFVTVKSILFMLDFLYIILNCLLIISFLCRINLRKRSLSFS